MAFLVLYPPNGDDASFRPKIPSEWEPMNSGKEANLSGLEFALRKLHEEFLETGNFLCVFEAFRKATEKRVYPPIWVLDLMQSRFDSYLSERGAKLDTAFGLSRGRGEATPWEESDRRARDLKLGRLVMKLESMGLSRPQACRALSSLLERLQDEQLPRLGFHSEKLNRMSLSGKAIHKAVDKVSEELYFIPIMFSTIEWTHEKRRECLAIFFKSELPSTFVREVWGS